MADNSEKAKGKPGPKEDRLALEGDWQEAMKKAAAKKRPPNGWPKPKKKLQGEQG